MMRLRRSPAVRWLRVGGWLLLTPSVPAAVGAQAALTQDEALALAFPAPLTVERRTAFLDEDALLRARARAGADIDITQSVVTYYVGLEDGVEAGRAYFDAHRVRTLPEVLMVVVTPASAIERIEVVRFAEPPEYRAPDGWMEMFVGRVLDDDLSLKGKIVNVTGATLTSIATTKAARRALAVHAVILEDEEQSR
jgi:hypothetical protein